ncbi:hypothetical protein [Sodalis praecaptivus]|uniref:hypothetical protein n=1 Tax=Sodalis TaxID=84565 RepID=UPI0011DD079E|nr:hypothetical protein [Sodalis praecaptivus]
MPDHGDMIAINLRQIHFDLAANEIEHSGCVTTTALARILRETRQTQITFIDGSSAKLVHHRRFIVYRDTKGYVINIEHYHCYG